MNLEDLKQIKTEISIPAHLDALVTAQLSATSKPRIKWKATAAVIFASVGVLNAVPAVATELRSFAAVQPVIDFLTLNRFDFKASSPDLRDIGPIGIELTDRYAAEAKALYQEYLASVGNPADFNKAVESTYEILWQNEEFLVVEHSLFEVMASGYQQVSYDVVDLANQQVLELSDVVDLPEAREELGTLVYDDLARQTAEGASIFMDELTPTSVLGRVSDFYVGTEGNLVFVFNEYEIAAGAQGVVEVEIPAIQISEYAKNTGLIK